MSDLSSVFSSDYTDSDCGYETDSDESKSRLLNRFSKIDLNHIDDDPRIMDKIMIRFYDLVITHGIRDINSFYEELDEPELYFEATKKMYYACCNYHYECKSYKGVSYRTILKKVSKIVGDDFFGFAFSRQATSTSR